MSGWPRLTRRAVAQLTEALLEIEEIASGASRRQIISLMDPKIRSAVPDADTARAHVLGWLRTCTDFPGGRANLVAALRLGVPDHTRRARVLALLDELWPDTDR